MTISPRTYERPAGVYLVSFYFVVAGFLESIKKYQETSEPFSLNPLADNSLWTLGVDIVIYMALAYAVWNLTRFGRLAALVYGYAYLAMYAGIGLYSWLAASEPRVTPLFTILATFQIATLVPVVWYLQSGPQKQLFRTSLWDILVGSD